MLGDWHIKCPNSKVDSKCTVTKCQIVLFHQLKNLSCWMTIMLCIKKKKKNKIIIIITIDQVKSYLNSACECMYKCKYIAGVHM